MGRQRRKKAEKVRHVAAPAPAPALAPVPLGAAVGVAAVAGAVSLAVYLRTLAPTVTLVDSGELIVAARDLGVAHPPGMPLWVLLAHLATRVPWGSVAQRVNAFSALCAAAAAALTALVTWAALRGPRDAPSDPAGERIPVSRAVPLWCASLGFAFCGSLWSYATLAEVYTLNSALLAGILLLLLLWRRSESDRLLLAAAALFGLALGVHHVTIALALPAFAVLVYGRAGVDFFRSRRLLAAAVVSAAALVLVYALLPLGAARQPVLNWGRPDSLQRIVWHVTGRQYQSFLSFSVEASIHEAAAFGRMALRQFGPPWLPLVLLLAGFGLWGRWRRDRSLAVALLVLIACNVAFGVSYVIAEDKDAYYLPTLLALALAAGLGAAELLDAARAGAGRTRAALAGLALLPLVPLVGNAPRADRSHYFIAEDYVANVLDVMQPGGLLLTSDWQIYAPLLYAREVEGRRPDVTVVDVQLLRRSWYYAHLRRRFPNLIRGPQASVDAFLEDLEAWEHDPKLYERDLALNRRINERFFGMIQAFARQHSGPVYATRDVVLAGFSPDPELVQRLGREYQAVPRGIVFELTRDRSFQPLAQPAWRLRGLFDGSLSFDADDVVALKVRPAYLTMLVSRGLYLAAQGDQKGAQQAYREALALDPGFAPAQQAAARSAVIESGSPPR